MYVCGCSAGELPWYQYRKAWYRFPGVWLWLHACKLQAWVAGWFCLVLVRGESREVSPGFGCRILSKSVTRYGMETP